MVSQGKSTSYLNRCCVAYCPEYRGKKEKIPSSFNNASITLISKPNEDTRTHTENYRPLIFNEYAAKILNKVSANRFQHPIKKIIYSMA